MIQLLFNPDTIYKLVLYHRIAIFLISTFFDICLIARFQWKGVGFVLLYESTKYYIFGERFLPEGIIVYPMVYLLGLIWEDKPISLFNTVITAISVWFIIFMREPYVPVALFFFFTIFLKQKAQYKCISLGIFTVLSLITILTQPFSDYFFNVFTVNSSALVHASDFTFFNVLKMFFYPFFILIDGRWNIFRVMLISLSVAYFIILYINITNKQNYKRVIIITIALFLANLRLVKPGTVFYEGFHLLPWYGMYIMSIMLLLTNALKHISHKTLTYVALVFTVIAFCFNIISSQSIIWERGDKNVGFTVGYGQYYSFGNIVKILSDTNDTLFLDGRDDLIYWQAGKTSPYKYAWYTSVMPSFSRYREAREQMFRESPPDFYYGSCLKNVNPSEKIPLFVKEAYLPVYFDGKPTCLMVHKTKKQYISTEALGKIKDLGYYIPN